MSAFKAVIAVSILFASLSAPALAEHPQPKAKLQQLTEQAKDGGILAAAAQAGRYSTFLSAVKAAGLTDKLQGEGPFTIFAPTDEAFAKLPEGALQDLLLPANQAKLAGLLGAHVVPGKLMADQVKTMKAANVNGQDLDIQAHDGHVSVNGAHVVQTDVAAANGVIHGIDTVLVPGAEPKAAEQEKPKDHPAH